MSTPTTNYALTKLAESDYYYRTVDNANLDIIDTAMKANADSAAGKANPSSTVLGMLATASWSGSVAPYTQTLTVMGLGATQNGTISIAQSATATQRAASLKAKLSVTGQAAGSLTVTADGTKPTVDIPVAVILMG